MDYANVKIPKDLATEIDQILKKQHYRSRGEFVIDVIRRRLEALKKKQELGQVGRTHK